MASIYDSQREQLSTRRIKAAWRYFHAWQRANKKKQEVLTVPELERWLAKVAGYANHSAVNNAFFCKSNFDSEKIDLLHRKLKARLEPGSRIARMDIFSSKDNSWAKEVYQPRLSRRRKKANSLTVAERKSRGKKDSPKHVRLRRQHSEVVLEVSARLHVKSARVKILKVARGGRQIVVRLEYTKKI